MKIFYVADTSLNKSAYSQHVIKMCDGLDSSI